MHRLIKALAIGLCLQWSLPVSASPVTCAINKLAIPLTANESLATQLTAVGSYFTVNCSCEQGETLVDSGSKVKLSIVGGTNVHNGSAGIRLSGSSGDFVLETEEKNYQVQQGESAYGQTYSYSVKVSAPDGEFLRPNPYAVAVQIDLFNPPTCQSSSAD